MTLRDYQIDISQKAAQCVIDNGMAYLAMETRTGKTMTAFETIRKLGVSYVLFVTKKKAIKSVEKDYQQYNQHFHLVVTNYESVSKIVGQFDLIVIDEAHSIGAYPKATKRVKDLLPFTKGKPIIYLSATPTPESWSQLYHQFYVSSFSPFKEYRNFYKWAHEYVTVKKKHVYNRDINDYSDAKIDQIQQFTKHLFFTQTQIESGFTETIREEIIRVPLNPMQQFLINKLRKDRIYEGKSGAVVLADTAVKMQSKIHQICSGTVKDEDGNGHIITYDKARAVKDKFTGQKIAVLYKFQAEFEMLKGTFDNWTDSPEEFQAGTDKTFLGQFQSAREGIRLDTADAIVFLNIDFSSLSYFQAKNRIVSKERTKDAILYWVFSIGGIEEKIYKMVIKKKDYTTRHFKRDYDVRSEFQAKVSCPDEGARVGYC